jgi:hypothetical protein
LAFDIFTDLLGFPVIQKKTSDFGSGSGFQPRRLISRLEAAPTGSFIKWALDFSDKQIGG